MLEPWHDETATRDASKLTSTEEEEAVATLPLPSVSVIVPTLNEEKNLPYVLPLIPEWVHEVVVVDGHSTDQTVELARSLRADVRVVYQKGRGKGNALIAGFHACRGDIIVTIDADGSTDPREIPAFVGALVGGADFAKGSRFMQGGGTIDMETHRRLGNWALRLTAKVLFGGRFSDLCYGYNAFWRENLTQLQPDRDGFEIETVLSLRAIKAGLRICEVASFEQRRIHGVSNLRAIADGIRILRTIFSERFTRTPSRVIDLSALETTEDRDFGQAGA